MLLLKAMVIDIAYLFAKCKCVRDRTESNWNWTTAKPKQYDWL